MLLSLAGPGISLRRGESMGNGSEGTATGSSRESCSLLPVPRGRDQKDFQNSHKFSVNFPLCLLLSSFSLLLFPGVGEVSFLLFIFPSSPHFFSFSTWFVVTVGFSPPLNPPMTMLINLKALWLNFFEKHRNNLKKIVSILQSFTYILTYIITFLFFLYSYFAF